MTETRLLNRFSTLLALIGLVWLAERIVPLAQSFGDILLLFFLAWLAAFILEPLVTALERLRAPRWLAVTLVYSVLILGLVLISLLVGPPVVAQIGELSDGLPDLGGQLPAAGQVTDFLARFGLPAPDLSAIYQPDALAEQLQASAGDLMQRALALATSAVTVVVNLLLLLIISFYMLLDGRRIIGSALKLLPSKRRYGAMLVLVQVSANFGGFLRGQVIQALLFGLAVAIVMIAQGMSYVAVTALASAVLMLMPLIGPVLSLVPPLVVALFHPQSVVVATMVVLFVVQTAIVNILMPRVLSGQMGLPPLLVFAAILFGLRIGGPLGAFFGIPIMGVIYGVASVLIARWRDEEAERQNGTSGEATAPRTNSP